jgi:hypothetical protein
MPALKVWHQYLGGQTQTIALLHHLMCSLKMGHTILPTSLLAFAASLILPLITASTPVCPPSAEGYQLDTLNTIYQPFCSDLSQPGFSASQEVYGVPVISLNSASTQTASSTSTGKPTATKPSVGSAALGTSDSAIMHVSGVSLLGVAFFFCFL